MKTSVPILCLLLTIACATTGPHENLYFEYGPDWTVGHHQEFPQERIIELVTAGETVENWTRLLTIQDYNKAFIPAATADQMMSGVRARITAQCPNARWNVIQRTDTTVLYEFKIANCSAAPDQHEIAVFLSGRDNLFRIGYATKLNEMPAADRTKWIGVLSNAKIITN
jgi:hypothetical protein